MLKKIYLTVTIFLILLSCNFYRAKALEQSYYFLNSIENRTPIKPTSFKLNVPLLSQVYPHYIPMGCECVASNMIYKFKGINIESKYLVDTLEKSYDPRKGFVGDMYSTLTYYGTTPTVWAEGLIKQVHNYRKASTVANGITIEMIEREILNGNPVIIWYAWEKTNIAIFTAEEPVFSSSALHAIVLVGYDEENFYINDPVLGNRKTNKEQLYKKFVDYGSHALVIR